MKCRICGKSALEIKGYLERVNPKGVEGIWECRPSCYIDDSRPSFGKIRVYRCYCGRLSRRPLHPKELLPCPCGQNLGTMEYEVEDGLLFAEKLIRGELP